MVGYKPPTEDPSYCESICEICDMLIVQGGTRYWANNMTMCEECKELADEARAEQITDDKETERLMSFIITGEER